MLTTQQLAKQLASFFADMGGETTVESISSLTGLSHEIILERLEVTEGVVYLKSYAEVWELFADQSPVCAAMHTATKKRA